MSALDGTGRLLIALYGDSHRIGKSLGGSEAPMLHAAADEIDRLRAALRAIGDVLQEWGPRSAHYEACQANHPICRIARIADASLTPDTIEGDDMTAATMAHSDPPAPAATPPAKPPVSVLHGVAISGYVLRLRLLAEGVALQPEVQAWMRCAASIVGDDTRTDSILRMVEELDYDEPVERYQLEAIAEAVGATALILEDAIRRAAASAS